jgi:CRISPR-associated protein Cmr5
MASVWQTEDQRRAQKAWADVCEVWPEQGKRDEKLAKGYRSLVRSAASDILKNGLGQMLAFLLAKDKGERKSEHWLLYSQLSRYANKGADLMKWVREADSESYRHATMEVLAYLNWLKRYAEAALPDPDSPQAKVSKTEAHKERSNG